MSVDPMDIEPSRVVVTEPHDLVQCQGCGAIRGSASRGMSHACWRNEDGTYEEGGTFQ